MKPSMDGPYAKLRRAEQHFTALKPEVLEAQKLGTYAAVKEIEPETGDYIWRMKIDRAGAARLAIVLGDALHNLRSSLDHLVYQLSLLTTKNPKGTEFPIYITKASNSRDCFEQKGREKIRHVPKDAQELIEAAQPYNARHPDQPSHHYLWLLHELNRLDKHRFVLETYAMTGTAILPLKRKRMIFLSGKLAEHPRTRCEEDDELLRISADYIADIEQDEEPEISFQVVLSIPIASDRPWYVVPVLNHIYHSISNDLFPDFTRFF